VVVGDEFAEQMTKMSLPKDHEVVQALRANGPHDSFRVRVAVWALGGNRHAVDARGGKDRCPSLREEWVAIMDEVGRVAEEAVDRVEEVASHSHHPGAVRIDVHPSDVDCARLELHDEEDHEADGAERAEGLDAEEVAGVQSFPVAPEELPPGPPPRAFRRRLEARVRQDAGHRGATDFDLEAAESVTDLGVAPAGILGGELDDKVADVIRLARPAGHPAPEGAVVLLGREVPKPSQDGFRAHDLATGLAVLRGKRLALQGQPSSLVLREDHPGPAGFSGEQLP
jgi:hypothetical protein